jgi:hypothetical protein
MGLKMTKGGNSGLIYHVVERPQFNAPYLTGPEYQMIDEVNFPGNLKSGNAPHAITLCI